MAMHLDSFLPDGHLQGTHLLDEHFYPAAASTWESRPLVFGRFRLAVAITDAVGNVCEAEARVHEQVVNSSPSAAHELVPAEWNAATGVMTFAFRPSTRLTG